MGVPKNDQVPSDPALEDQLVAIGRLLGEGPPNDAEPRLHALVEAHPGNPSVWAMAARWRQTLADQPGEAAALKRLLEIKPDHVGAHGRLADLLEAAGDLAEAAPHLKRYAEAKPGKTRIWVRLAQAAEAAGDWPEAEAAWTRVCELYPNQIAAAERLTALRAAAKAPARALQPPARSR